ncbi:chemotaxis response regulator protein-glutamate methylesterase [Nocardioides sp. 616]|uniref:protein-glutamate methylesterase/protein-glutamine glutaminase n=1 Tax=Nocardioides sp. 616 TaxID=2268090 RepID=UPI000CE483FD|nr:chemotaxis response regulator protein-glutamate methylesterase [Nocardioides sp. 616]
MIRVLVVDDSAPVRRLVTVALEIDPDIQVVGRAVDGRDALAQVKALKPDVVTLDIEMPVVDGLQALARLRERYPRLPVIMFSTLTARGAAKTLEALTLGASDFVLKPTTTGSVAESVREVHDQLVPRIKGLVGVYRMFAPGSTHAGPQPAALTSLAAAGAPAATPEVLLVGASTGGPDALNQLLPALPGDLAVPVVVVQHMPPVFTTMFAARLDRVCALEVHEAGEGDVLRPGHVYVAPGGRHLALVACAEGARTALLDTPPENFCRPAVDVLFRSAAAVYGPRVLALVMTGMGQDGAAGSHAVALRSGRVLAQDEASSVVWGMPGAVVHAGLATEVLALDALAPRLIELLAR